MNKVFEPKRFGNYLLHDIRTAKDNYLYSFLVTAGLPVLVFAIVELFHLLFSPSHSLSELSRTMQGFTLFAGTVSTLIVFPIKQYGQITEKRYGSSWILLPASSFEKWLSLIILTCVLAPICFFVVFGGCDWLMSVIFPKYYPTALFSLDTDALAPTSEIQVNPLGIAWMSWIESILSFTLGAIVFKKAKFPKTILCLMLLGFIISALALAFFGSDFNNFESMMKSYSQNLDVDEAIRRFKAMMYIWYGIFTLALGGCTYLRIANIKH